MTGAKLQRGLAVLALAAWLSPAAAGGGGAERPQFEPEQIAAFSKKVERAIAARGARVALISRVGRPPAELPEGIEYTHVGFVVYSKIRLHDGRTVPGYASYNLYQDQRTGNTSYLAQDYPLDYYAAVYELSAGVIIPEPELQRRLLRVIFSDTYAKLHNADYSAIANPFDTRYQNCTEFVLDVVNAAVYDTDDVAAIKANELAYFEPQPVNVDGFELFLASLFTPDIMVSDHPGGPIQTATFGSLARYMEEHGLASEVFAVAE